PLPTTLTTTETARRPFRFFPAGSLHAVLPQRLCGLSGISQPTLGRATLLRPFLGRGEPQQPGEPLAAAPGVPALALRVLQAAGTRGVHIPPLDSPAL